MEALRNTALLAAALVVAIGGCTAGSTGSPECTVGVDHSLKSTGTCGAAVTVTVKTGSSCLPSAFTGFNSELAGFPTATNNDHPVSTVLVWTLTHR